jgi:GntR family transcriptional regulator, transcriptional repressor for pyruvate dehydrogenase complex
MSYLSFELRQNTVQAEASASVAEVLPVQGVSLRRRSLVDEVVEKLRILIEDSALSAGERLPTEAQLVQKLGVSRNALREAIRRLETVGLIWVRHGQGMFVGDREGLSGCTKLFRSAMAMSGKDLTDVAELRCVIEYYTVRRAAELASPEQVAELWEALVRMACEDQTHEEAIRTDFEFHRKLADVAGNQLMLTLMTILEELLLSAILLATEKPRAFRANFEIHRAIWEAVRSSDPDAAEQAMRYHMKVFCSRIAQTAEVIKGD